MAVDCKPTIAPPIAFGLNPSSFTARTMPTESGGYEQTTTRSGLAAAIARTIGAKSVDARRIGPLMFHILAPTIRSVP